MGDRCVSNVTWFVVCVLRDIRRALRRWPFWILLVLASGNLLARLTFGLADVVPATRIVLDVIYAEYVPVAALLVLYGRALLPVRDGWRLAAQAAAGTVLIVATMTAAGLLAIVYQLARGHGDLHWGLTAIGLYFNLSWPLLHLLAMATFLHAVTGARLAVLAAGAIYLFARLAFEHPLLRFGAPHSPWSDLNGYGPFLAEHLAAGGFWTAISALLVVAAHVLRRPRRAVRQRLTPNVVSAAWGACVASAVTGLWIVLNANTLHRGDRAAVGSAPQPSYSRLDLALEIYPHERSLISRGIAILVNRHDVAIPRLRFAVPQPMTVHALTLTGQLEQRHARFLVYRLNRPLEPRETLRVEFDLAWAPAALPRDRVGTGVLANGTFVRVADIVPALGQSDAKTVVFRARVGTALDQIAVAPGVLARRWKEDGRSYFEYHAEQGASSLAPILSARYAIANVEWQQRPIDIYHHPAHAPNLDRLAAAARTYLSTDGSAAPLRVVEVPDYRRFANTTWLLGGTSPIASTHQFVDGMLCYPELDGFKR